MLRSALCMFEAQHLVVDLFRLLVDFLLPLQHRDNGSSKI